MCERWSGNRLPGTRGSGVTDGRGGIDYASAKRRRESGAGARQAADVYVMPSVSEPFGLTALEAAQQGVPIVLAASSGVAEILPHGALKVDFWDVRLMARMIVTVLRSPAVADALRRQARAEIQGLTWEAAEKCMRVHQQVAG